MPMVVLLVGGKKSLVCGVVCYRRVGTFNVILIVCLYAGLICVYNCGAAH